MNGAVAPHFMVSKLSFIIIIIIIDMACIRYVSAEVVRILDLLEDEYYVPSSGLVLHILYWL